MLETLEVADIERRKNLSPLIIRRNKLIRALHDQLLAAEAFVEGRQLMKKIQRTVKDKETGSVSTFTIERPVHPWFWVDDLGGVYMNVRYGSKIINVKDGFATIVVNSVENLVPTVQLLKEAAAWGDFDESIQDVQRNYGRPIKKTKTKAAKDA